MYLFYSLCESIKAVLRQLFARCSMFSMNPFITKVNIVITIKRYLPIGTGCIDKCEQFHSKICTYTRYEISNTFHGQVSKAGHILIA